MNEESTDAWQCDCKLNIYTCDNPLVTVTIDASAHLRSGLGNAGGFAEDDVVQLCFVDKRECCMSYGRKLTKNRVYFVHIFGGALTLIRVRGSMHLLVYFGFPQVS